MISFINITKSFKNDFWAKPFSVLDKVNFQIAQGDLIGFLGANGAGKTTLMKILMGFIKSDGGTILFDRQAMGRNQNEVMSRIGYLPERPYFYPHLSGREFLEYMGKLYNVPPHKIEQNIAMWASRLKIDFALARKIRGYSKGMLQRLGFLSTLIHDPLLLILDEPLSGLDPIGRKELKGVIRELHQKGKTIFFSSHIVSDVEEISSHIVVLEKGKVFYEGKTDHLIANHMRQQYQVTYFLDSKKTELVSLEQKNALIDSIVKEKGEIYSVEQCRPTLEEIIYRVGGNR